jgi:hypothetical protein
MIRILSLFVIAVLVPSYPTDGAISITVQQVGPDVIASFSGSVDLGGLSLESSFHFATAGFEPSSGGIWIGPPPGSTIAHDRYGSLSTGWANYGSGNFTGADVNSGDVFGFGVPGKIVVANGYVSNSFISGSSTFQNTDYTTIGLTPGVYNASWGSGGNFDSATLTVTPIPEPAAWIGMLGLLVLVRALVSRFSRGLYSAIQNDH